MINENPFGFGFVKSIRIGFCAERGYYISELTPNPDMMQPSALKVAKLIHEFNSLINTGLTIEEFNQQPSQFFDE